ncbi:hypothetical protein [Amycolatopsis sp. NPDC006125]|uniref:hypothetical protein n=1 Tax=Amycolatopsis sp. NPDC006125 TaxID=3156730 RepID=UPI0033AD4AA3
MRIALEKTEGASFERFVNEFYPAIAGGSYVPLGGNKDGGADAFEGGIFESNRTTNVFYQASIEQDAQAKVRRTVKRLREFGRSPERLIYITSKRVKYIDKVEADLTDELDVSIVIRDGEYIVSHVNDGFRTIAAFNEHLRHYTDFLRNIGRNSLIAPSRHVKSPAVFVFLAQEVERRRGDEKLVDAVTDALILWALEGTDPELGEFRTEDQVRERIIHELPSVEALVAPRLRRRLRAMSRKSYETGRAVRWYQQDNKFCLPYETRSRLEGENVKDEGLILDVKQSLEQRIRQADPDGLGEKGIASAAEVSLRALQLAFEKEGLEFSSFLEDPSASSDYPAIADAIKQALSEFGHSGRRGLSIGAAAFDAVRRVLYDSNEDERTYLHKLAKTYALLFTLNTEPRLVEFFQDMAGDFYLYVGSDVLIRALSEYYLNTPDQMTKNTLLMARRLGAKLILTGPVLEEVIGHLRVCDAEYNNHVAGRESHLTYEAAREAPHILLRAYLYARLRDDLGRRRPKGWPAFVGLFCDYGDLRRPSAQDAVRMYLQVTFGLEFRTREELRAFSSDSDVESLTAALETDKKDRRLAYNDALMALAVYGRRNKRRESSTVSEFGYQTWWLTGETSILKHTRPLVREHGSRYVMRPDFLLNFFTLAPKAADARSAFSAVFPTSLGVRLGRRIDSGTFHKIMEKVGAAEDMDEARRTAAIARICDQLKSDFNREYFLLEDRGGHNGSGIDRDAAYRAQSND